MKLILISVLMLSMTLIFISCGYESQPTQNTSDVETKILKKKPKPGNNLTSELITFVGDLTGSQVVEGCCPNAGPYPEYTMTLSGALPNGIYYGNLFMNNYGRGKIKSYIVQFWTETIFLEIRGGLTEKDKRTKITTVTFTNEPCVIDGDEVLVNFTLTRVPQ